MWGVEIAVLVVAVVLCLVTAFAGTKVAPRQRRILLTAAYVFFAIALILAFVQSCYLEP